MSRSERSSQHQSSVLKLVLAFVVLQLSSVLGNKAAEALGLPDEVSLILWILLCALLLVLELDENERVERYHKLLVVVVADFIAILVWASIRGWPAMKFANYFVVTVMGILAFGRMVGWLPIPSDMRAAVRGCLDWMANQFQIISRYLSQFIPATLPPQFAWAIALAAASLVLTILTVLLGGRIRIGFGVIYSLILAVREIAKAYQDQVVFTTLGLASFAVLLVLLVTIVYDGYRRLAAVFLAVAFLALATLFCTYTGPAIVEEGIKIVETLRPSATPAPATPVPATPTLILTPTEEPTEAPTPPATERPIPTVTISPSPTWTRAAQPPSEPMTSTPTQIPPSPTRVQPSMSPTSRPPTQIPPSPTRVQPPPPPPTDIPPPTRIQPPS